jgi:hypothetical protein
MENVGICYSRLQYITAIWRILLIFGTLVKIWYIFPHFDLLCQEKSGNPGQHSVYVLQFSGGSSNDRGVLWTGNFSRVSRHLFICLRESLLVHLHRIPLQRM